MATGTERAALPLSQQVHAVACFPAAPAVACGDEGGVVHLARLVGLDYGLLVAIATRSDDTLTVRCPTCMGTFQIDSDRLGIDMTCPQPECGTDLAINPFMLDPSS